MSEYDLRVAIRKELEVSLQETSPDFMLIPRQIRGYDAFDQLIAVSERIHGEYLLFFTDELLSSVEVVFHNTVRDVVPPYDSYDHKYWRLFLRMAALCHDIGHLAVVMVGFSELVLEVSKW